MIRLKVNGKNHRFNGDPNMPLLWFLRDEIDLKGTKYGCGMGLCGACTVHVNGRPARACLTPVSAAANAAVTTIEGVSPDGSHPVQVAWEELDVPQCGYCQAGQIMSACALLSSKPKPTDADIDTAMNGNLCRCGTYLRVRAAVHKAAELTAANRTRPAKPAAKASSARTTRNGGNK
ncbi:MAG: (2Fe-2S)-binding protein [Acidobacteria bacterium]|nr:(2Fe-2S)-binding protein [Acidobacteriota bacterium]